MLTVFVAAFCCSGELTAAQALDKVTTQDYVLIDVRTDKDKAKAGVPQLPSNAKNKLISVPYAPISFLGHAVRFLIIAMKAITTHNLVLSITSQAGGASKQTEGHGAQREESRGGDHGSEDFLPQENQQGL